MSSLTLTTHLLAYDDVLAGSNPRLKRVDWSRAFRELSVDRPKSDEYDVQPGQEVVLFDGSRTLSADGSTEYSIAQSPLSTDRYRLAWTGNGTSPQFKLDRNINFVATLAITVNANGSVSITGVGPNYTLAQPGDTVVIPGVSTGDAAGPFALSNEGYWTVLAADSVTLTLARPNGTAFTGETQASVVVANNEQIKCFVSADRVNVGDIVEISGGFASSAQRSFKVLAISVKYLDIQSSTPLAAQTAVPGATGLKVYSDAKRVVYIETDQELAVRYNGDTGSTNRCEPLSAPDGTRAGVEFKTGPVWKLAVYNRGTSLAKVLLIAAA